MDDKYGFLYLPTAGFRLMACLPALAATTTWPLSSMDAGPNAATLRP